MSGVFADSYYFFALLNPNDQAHQRAVAVSRQRRDRTVTTEFILLEVADGLASVATRELTAALVDSLRRNPHVTIVPASESLFAQGLSLYSERADKASTLTDCISFVVMQEFGLTEALTGDRHFQQAGFTALLSS